MWKDYGTLSGNINDPEIAYLDKYFYCYICVPYIKRKKSTHYPNNPHMQYADWEIPIAQLTSEDVRISESANITPKITSTYIDRVRVADKNSNVPPGSVFEEEGNSISIWEKGMSEYLILGRTGHWTR